MINDAQMRKIWAVAREKGMDEDMVRSVAQAVSGRPSISGLTSVQASAVIDRMLNKGGRRTKPQRDPNMMTEKQEWKIRQLEKELGWQDNPQRLQAFVKKYARVERLDWLTLYKARNIIDGLKALLARQKGGSENGVYQDVRNG